MMQQPSLRLSTILIAADFKTWNQNYLIDEYRGVGEESCWSVVVDVLYLKQHFVGFLDPVDGVFRY